MFALKAISGNDAPSETNMRRSNIRESRNFLAISCKIIALWAA